MLGGDAPASVPTASANPLSASAAAGDFLAGRRTFARSFSGAFDEFHYSDLMDGAFAKGGSNVPTEQGAWSGGVYRSPGGAGNGYINFTEAANTPDLNYVSNPAAESWLMSVRAMLPTTPFTAATFIVPVGMFSGGSGLVYIQSIPGTSGTVFQITIDGTTSVASCGAVGTLGGATLPVGVYVWISMGFNLLTGTFKVWFDDVEALSTQAIVMPSGPGSPVFCYSSDNTMQAKVSDIFIATVAPS